MLSRLGTLELATADPQLDLHCPSCGYNLTGLRQGAACPECGLENVTQRGVARHLQRPWLHRFLMLLVVVTFALLMLGGTVTSKGVGMAVPDWPTTYEYNMFLFPPSMWVGGIFWEHTHRLMGALVGMLTIIACAWLWLTQKQRPWLRWLGVVALLLVILQGVMGGFRVTHDPTHPRLALTLAIFHGITGQLFLCMTVLMAAATGRIWLKRVTGGSAGGFRGVRRLALALLAIMVIQLSLGAAMRHTDSGLAIPDFPTAFGGVIPPLTPEGIEYASEHHLGDIEVYSLHYPTPAQVGVHFAHRVWAVVVVAAAVWLLTKLAKLVEAHPNLRAPMTALIGLLIVQLALGALVIWSGRHPEVATAHQATGAALLAVGAWLAIRIHLLNPADTSLSHNGRAGTAQPRTGRGALSFNGAGA